jgi:hypothetical protein
MSVHTVVPVVQVGQVEPPIPMLENPRERARARFDELVSLGRSLGEAQRAWARLGRIAVAMEKDEDFTALGYESIGAMFVEIENLTGYSRSSIYAAKKLYEQVAPNGGEDVMEMSLGSAHVYKQLPAQLQRDPEVKESAKKLKPQQFEEKIETDHPEAHVEARERFIVRLTRSQGAKRREIVDMWRALNEDPNAPIEDVDEAIYAEYYLNHHDEYRAKMVKS